MDLVLEHPVNLDAMGMRATAATVRDMNSADKPYPAWTRLLIILGGSVLLWALIGMSSVLAAQPSQVGVFLEA